MKDISLYVFDMNLKRLAFLDRFESAEFVRNFYDHSMATVVLPATEQTRKLFFEEDSNPQTGGRVIVRSDDLTRGYLVSVAQYDDGQAPTITLSCYSMSYLLASRVIPKQQRFQGNIESAMRYFVSNNSITNRPIPNLVSGSLFGITKTGDISYTGDRVDEALYGISKNYEVSWEVLINHNTKKFEFVAIEGKNRSDNQNTFKRIRFSKQFENVITQSYVDNWSGYRSTAYVAGEGEGIERTVAIYNDSETGLSRRELYVDARDIQSEYRDDDGNDQVIPPQEYENILLERGASKLQEYQRVRTFECVVNAESQFQFNRDFFLGDIVSNRSDDLGIVSHNRVVVTTEKFDRSGYTLEVQFGEAIPTIVDKIRREVRR